MYADIINIVSSELQSVYIRLRHLGLGFFHGYKCFSPKRERAQTVLGKIPIQTQHSQSRLDAGIHIFHLGRCCSNTSHCSTRCLWQNHFCKKKKNKTTKKQNEQAWSASSKITLRTLPQTLMTTPFLCERQRQQEARFCQKVQQQVRIAALRRCAHTACSQNTGRASKTNGESKNCRKSLQEGDCI